MSTIETNSEQQEFDPDSLLGVPTEPEEQGVKDEYVNFIFEYSIFEKRPTNDRFEIEHKLEAYASSFKVVDSSHNSKFEIKFETAFLNIANLIVANNVNTLKVNRVKFHDLKLEMSKVSNTKLLELTYVETDKTNKTGIATIKF